MLLSGRAHEDLDRVLFVEQLDPRIESERGRHHRQREVARERRVDLRPDEVGEPQDREADVRPAAAEAARVVLDLPRVFRVPRPRVRARTDVFGEDRRIRWIAAVHRRRRLHDDLTQLLRLLARGEQLHRPDDVDLFHLRAPARTSRRRDNGGVHDGIDFGRLKHLDDQRVPDVCAHELRARELHARRLEVDAEDLTDVGILL